MHKDVYPVYVLIKPVAYVIMIWHIVFSLAAIGVTRAGFGRGTGTIWLDNVDCVGTEGVLTQCPANPFGRHNCDHSEDAGVRCLSKLVHGG